MDKYQPSRNAAANQGRPVIAPKRKPSSITVTEKLHDTQTNGGLSEKNLPVQSSFATDTELSKGTVPKVSPPEVTRESLDFVGVTNRTSAGLTLVWDSPQGKNKKLVRSGTESVKREELQKIINTQKQDKDQQIKVLASNNRDHETWVPDEFVTQAPKTQGSTVSQSTSSAGSSHSEHLPPQTDYTLTLLGKGPGLLSRLQKLVISTGPEPPSNIVFSKVTENSLTVSWTKPKSPVSGFKVTYIHADEGEPVSVSVDSEDSTLDLSQLSPGSSYEVSVISTLGLDESDPIKDFVVTLPDPPTDLKAVNVTDTKALLLWRPALVAVDKYTIVYGAGTGSMQDTDGAQDLQAKNVTPRTALISWTPSLKPVDRYILVYKAEGEEPKEIIVGPSITQYKLSRLHPANTFAKFTTGALRFPFPTDCSQELLNGILTSDVVEIFPQGRSGKSVMVYCDMETDGGGWTVFQRRKDGSVDFYRGWNDYVKGFGDLSGEFWLGLEILHNLTTMTKMNLRVDLRDGGETVFAQYSKFSVAKRNYKLTVDEYRGTAGDSLSYHNNCIFSTKDRDPIPGITRCAISYQGGWWYKNCHAANLNGLYGIDYKHQGVIWKSWKGKDHSIQFTEMKMRPAAFRIPTRG
uniref:Tenascin XB n=1 Tax=Nothobranchius furzeri TaxID=105023 RepID=A0A8C6M6M5_NOTFU